jgi:hypothetical protein
MIKFLLDKGYVSAASARFLEYVVISGLIFAAVSFLEGSFSWNGLAVAVITPIIGALRKEARDLKKELDLEEADASTPLETNDTNLPK